MTRAMAIETRTWLMKEPFEIARGTQTEMEVLVVTLRGQNGERGRGEGCGVPYAGETPQSMVEDAERVRTSVEAGISRESLLELLPAGGARCAIDCALWDLEAREKGVSAFELAGVAKPRPIETAYTIGMRSLDEYSKAARSHAEFGVIKVKVDDRDPVAAVDAVRQAAPKARLIVDANQSWTLGMLEKLDVQLRDLGVVLLEQPIKVGDEAGLSGPRAVPICADELINGEEDLPKAAGRFDYVNIKLDKAGGLTAALELARACREAGFKLMVGCMGGSSLSMAPALVLAHSCTFADLDGPLLQADDWPDGLRYRDGMVTHSAAFWGG